MIKQIDKDLWKIKENDFEAVVDTKGLLLYINGIEIGKKNGEEMRNGIKS